MHYASYNEERNTTGCGLAPGSRARHEGGVLRCGMGG